MYALCYRPAMIQGIALGANSGGTLESVTHDAITVTSQYEDYFRQETGWSGLLYKCANANSTRTGLVRQNRTDCSRHPFDATRQNSK
jgi:xanthine dehydrogenase YagR molybdenum-binding subunit